MEKEEKKSEIVIKNDYLGFIGCSIGCALWIGFIGVVVIILIKALIYVWNAIQI